jgi:hypothetical protein
MGILSGVKRMLNPIDANASAIASRRLTAHGQPWVKPNGLPSIDCAVDAVASSGKAMHRTSLSWHPR